MRSAVLQTKVQSKRHWHLQCEFICCLSCEKCWIGILYLFT